MKKVNKAYQLYLEQERELRAKLYKEIELEFITLLERNGCHMQISDEEGLSLKPAENYEETASILEIKLNDKEIELYVYEFGSYAQWSLEQFDIDERIALLKYLTEQEESDEKSNGDNSK